MNIFSSRGAESEEKMRSDCKPDYEKLIEEIKRQIAAGKDLHNALMHYLECSGHYNTSEGFTLSSLLGSLDLEEQQLVQRLGQYMAKWEK